MLLNLWEQIQRATPQALLSLGHCPPLSFLSHSNFWTIYVPFLPISLVPTHASTVCIPLTLWEVILAKSLLTMLLAKYDWHTLVPLWTDPSLVCDTTESSFLPETLLLPGDSAVPFYFDYLASPDYCFSAECTGTSSCTGPLQVGVSWGSRIYSLSLSAFSLSYSVHCHGLHHPFIYWQHICFLFLASTSISKSEYLFSLGITSAAHQLLLLIYWGIQGLSTQVDESDCLGLNCNVITYQAWAKLFNLSVLPCVKDSK